MRHVWNLFVCAREKNNHATFSLLKTPTDTRRVGPERMWTYPCLWSDCLCLLSPFFLFVFALLCFVCFAVLGCALLRFALLCADLLCLALLCCYFICFGWVWCVRPARKKWWRRRRSCSRWDTSPQRRPEPLSTSTGRPYFNCFNTIVAPVVQENVHRVLQIACAATRGGANAIS